MSSPHGLVKMYQLYPGNNNENCSRDSYKCADLIDDDIENRPVWNVQIIAASQKCEMTPDRVLPFVENTMRKHISWVRPDDWIKGKEA